MLFVAQFEEEHDLIVDAVDAEDVYAVCEEHGQGRPVAVRPIPARVFVAELWLADEDHADETTRGVGAPDDELPNPANRAQAGIAFEPLDGTALWFAAMIVEDIEASANEDEEGGHAH